MIILRVLRWKPDYYRNAYTERPDNDKYIMVAAPHTSLLDQMLGMLAVKSIEDRRRELDGKKKLRTVVFVKKDLLEHPILGIIARFFNSVPVDRENPKNNVVMLKMIKKYIKEGHVRVVIAPEATREPVTEWNAGYWALAKMNKVPLYSYGVDHSTKTFHSLGYYDITGDYDKDSEYIQKLFEKRWAKYPEKFLTHDEMVAARKG